MTHRSRIPRLVRALGQPLQYALYIVLRTVRPIVVAVSLLIGVLALGCGVVYGCYSGWTSLPCLVLLGVGLVLVAIGFCYDAVLALIAPERVGLYF